MTSNNVLYNKSQTEIIQYPIGNNQMTQFSILSSVTSIRSNAFTNCHYLQRFLLEEENPQFSVDEIGILYNNNKSLLIQYPIGNTQTTFGMEISVNTIKSYAFYGNEFLISLTFSQNLNEIGSKAFSQCSKLKDIRYTGQHILEICGKKIFEGSVLEQIETPRTYQGKDFCGYEVSPVLDIGECGKTCQWMLSDDGLLTISGKGEIENYNEENNKLWFDNKTVITSVKIEDGITSIGNSAFKDLSNLQTIDIPKTVTSIGSNAFEGCSQLEYFYFSSSISSIGDNAFLNCNSNIELVSLRKEEPQCSTTVFDSS